MMKLLALALMIGAASAACPNACSGHGTCNGSGICTCFLEGKALYVNAQADPTAGWQRGDGGGEAVTRTQDYRRAVFVFNGNTQLQTIDGPAPGTAPVYADSGAANAGGITIMDGGAGYMSASSQACAYDNTFTDYVGKGCPLIGVKTDGGGTAAQNAAAECTATVVAGAITRIRCGNAAAAGFSAATAAGTTFTVAAPSYDQMDRQTPMAQWTGADCSLMTCPRGMSWIKVDATIPDKNGLIKDHLDNVECSDGGVCDRGSGKCNCFPGFEGSACQRTACPDGCSGHGVCQSNIKFASQAGARFLNSWDSGKEFGCKCDSGFRGLNCADKECPSGDDPLGYQGNDEGRDCSGRGSCDYSSGDCQCYAGFTGTDCSQVQALA